MNARVMPLGYVPTQTDPVKRNVELQDVIRTQCREAIELVNALEEAQELIEDNHAGEASKVIYAALAKWGREG